jgi:hypothetical protein
MEVISHGAVASPLIGYKHAMIRNGDYSAAFMVAQMLKDLSKYCRYRAHWWSTHGHGRSRADAVRISHHVPSNKKEVSSYIVKAR